MEGASCTQCLTLYYCYGMPKLIGFWKNCCFLPLSKVRRENFRGCKSHFVFCSPPPAPFFSKVMKISLLLSYFTSHTDDLFYPRGILAVLARRQYYIFTGIGRHFKKGGKRKKCNKSTKKSLLLPGEMIVKNSISWLSFIVVLLHKIARGHRKCFNNCNDSLCK